MLLINTNLCVSNPLPANQVHTLHACIVIIIVYGMITVMLPLKGILESENYISCSYSINC